MSDLNDLDLEDLMAELEAQNASIAEDSKPEPELPPTQETLAEEMLDIDPVAMQPTATDRFNADQEVQLAEAFTPPVEPELNVDEVMPGTVEVEPIAEVKATPVEAVQAEPEPQPEPEMTPAAAPEIEKRELNLKTEPQDDDEPSVNERSYKDAVKLKYEPNVSEFQMQTKITDANFEQCILDQASLMAYHSALYAQAEAQVARVKLKFETLEAGLYDAYRKRFADMGEKVTEKAIENAVRLDKKWAKAKLLLIEAQTYADIHKGFVNSLTDRRSMLMSRGASLRDEMKGQLRVMAQVDPESPVNVQARAENNDMAARAMAIARGAFQRAG